MSTKSFLLIEQIVEVSGDLEAAQRALESGAEAPHLDIISGGARNAAHSIRTFKPVRVTETIDPNRLPKGLKKTGSY